ncbi:DUF4848 domain-containing protein [Marinilabiliaceae bacterium JC017]|nr:DUF4848 domain-containing protein [Marinilabiliaceae bacterium JC017]
MKKVSYYLLLLGLLGIFQACQKDDNEVLEVEKKDVWSENGVPAYKDEATFVKALKSANYMSDEERAQWEKEVGFFSLMSAYDLACEEYANIQNVEEYLNFKENYKDLFVFSESDNDPNFFYPVEKISSTPGLDMYGRAIIGGELKNFKTVKDINYWWGERNLLKNAGDDIDHCKHIHSKRQVLCLVEETQWANEFLIYISGQKKNWLGWHKYRTHHYIEPSQVIGLREDYDNGNAWTKNIYCGPNNPWKSNGAKEKSKMFFTGPTGYNSSISFKIWTDGVTKEHACTLNYTKPRYY